MTSHGVSGIQAVDTVGTGNIVCGEVDTFHHGPTLLSGSGISRLRTRIRSKTRMAYYTHNNLQVSVLQYLLIYQDASRETQSRSTVARSVPI
jgi:hypothetical protein